MYLSHHAQLGARIIIRNRRVLFNMLNKKCRVMTQTGSQWQNTGRKLLLDTKTNQVNRKLSVRERSIEWAAEIGWSSIHAHEKNQATEDEWMFRNWKLSFVFSFLEIMFESFCKCFSSHFPLTPAEENKTCRLTTHVIKPATLPCQQVKPSGAGSWYERIKICGWAAASVLDTGKSLLPHTHLSSCHAQDKGEAPSLSQFILPQKPWCHHLSNAFVFTCSETQRSFCDWFSFWFKSLYWESICQW